MGRWGEKVPATVGTVADRFAVLQVRALHLKGAFLTAEGTKSSAVGTGLLFAQGGGLLFEEGLQGALGESRGGGQGNLLHGRKIDIESGPVVAEGASGDDFAPLSGEAAEFVEFLRGEAAACHDASCLGVEVKARGKMAPSTYD